MPAKTSSESISSLLDTMRSLLIVAGIPKEQIRIRKGKPRIETLSKAFDWLHNLKISPAFEDLIKVWKLLPEAIWARYKLYQIEGLKEQELLIIASKKVLKLWKTKRPAVFNKDRKKDDKKK